MRLVPEQAAFLLDVCKLVEYITSCGYVVTGGELWRPPEMQEIYVRDGRSKTMKSNHLNRLAIDLNFFKDGTPVTTKEAIKPFGDFWEQLNPANRWGGNFTTIKDVPHFERNVS